MHYQTAGQSYLEASILTAPPQRLRLMLIEKACQLCSRITNLWQQDARAQAEEPALQLRDILGELLSGVTRSGGSLGEQVADLYVFLLQRLTAAEEEGNAAILAEVARVLEIERETWQEVCQKMALEAKASSAKAFSSSHAPHLGGLSLRA